MSSTSEYESQAAYNHDFSELKKGIRESVAPLVKVDVNVVFQQLATMYIQWYEIIKPRLSSDVMQNHDSSSAVICIVKGAVEGVVNQKVQIVFSS